jgi:dGTPase
VYADDLPVFTWLRSGAPPATELRPRRCVEAQIMDLADDVAYSVHDVEDGVVAGRIDLSRLDRDAVWEAVRDWYLPDLTDDHLQQALDRLRSVDAWPTTSYDGSRRQQAELKNLTSDLIGRFCSAAQDATFAASDGPFLRHEAAVSVPMDSAVVMAVLKGIAAHYVMRTDDRRSEMEGQRTLLAELFDRLVSTGGDHLDRGFADDWAAAPDDAARRRVVVDQVASLTDASAVAWHARLC